MADDNPNGKKPSPSLERSQAQCPKCHQIFDGLLIEEIDQLKQLRISGGLVEHLRLRCLHCGELFNWNFREKDILRMIDAYSVILSAGSTYRPE